MSKLITGKMVKFYHFCANIETYTTVGNNLLIHCNLYLKVHTLYNTDLSHRLQEVKFCIV